MNILQSYPWGRYRSYPATAKLNRSTNLPIELLPILKRMFEQIYNQDFKYRATGIYLVDLHPAGTIQVGLFEDPVIIEKLEKLYKSVDEVRSKYGRNSIYLGTSHLVSSRARGERNKDQSFFLHKE